MSENESDISELIFLERWDNDVMDLNLTKDIEN
jgi:hypothetical protein